MTTAASTRPCSTPLVGWPPGVIDPHGPARAHYIPGVDDSLPTIALDGSQGEGGGQILRTALSLSAITGRPFTIAKLRANRDKAGLRPQHREATRAVARLVDAEVVGDDVGSTRLEFRPRRRATPGEWTLDVGTAGSTPLLFQTICWPLALAGGASFVTLRG